MANPPKNLTPKDLDEVETMAGLGMRFEDIARLKGMCLDTLKKHAGEQLNRGRAKAKAAVMQTAYKMALSGKYPAMTMFWLKTQAAWSETMPEESPTKGELSGGLDTFLKTTMEQVKSGQLDPKVASVIASLSGVLLKATEQSELIQRLALLEDVLMTQPKTQAGSLLNQTFNPDSIVFTPLEEP
jgi:hypothetical protein